MIMSHLSRLFQLAIKQADAWRILICLVLISAFFPAQAQQEEKSVPVDSVLVLKVGEADQLRVREDMLAALQMYGELMSEALEKEQWPLVARIHFGAGSIYISRGQYEYGYQQHLKPGFELLKD